MIFVPESEKQIAFTKGNELISFIRYLLSKDQWTTSVCDVLSDLANNKDDFTEMLLFSIIGGEI